MDSRQIEELLPFYALDALTDEEHQLVEEYLQQHPEARQQVEEMRNTASALPLSVSPVEPSLRTKKALMARVAADVRARSSVQSQPSSRVNRFENIFRVFSLGAAVAALIWAIFLNIQVARLQNEIAGLNHQLAVQSQSLEQIVANLPQSSPSEVITVSLKGTNVQPKAQGQLIADPTSQTAVLVITGLPQLEAGRTYQVWLINGGAPVSAGLLSVNPNGQGVIVVTSEEAIGSFQSLGISIEPEGGSPQPTGDIVVLSEL